MEVFIVQDIEDLREKLEGLLGDREVVDRYKREAVEFICGKYNWDNVVEKTMRVYR